MYFEAEDEALELQDFYSPAAVDAISYGTYMKLQIAKHSKNEELCNMMHWLYANVEFSAAALATDLSVSRWADDDQFGFTGDHVWLAGACCSPRCTSIVLTTETAAKGANLQDNSQLKI